MTLAVSIAQGGSNNVTMRNRVINGNMAISQRGTSFTNPASGDYTLDRFQFRSTNVGQTLTIAQNAGSVNPPAGFSYYLGCTMSNAYSPISSDRFAIGQCIEGFNMADFGWGTAGALSVTLSFWVRSSLTGTFGGAVKNSAEDYAYPFSFTINSANTWEQKTVLISGPTAGTWIGATNGIGARIYWSIGAGSSKQGAAGTWASADYWSATGAVNVCATNGATFYITGVQLEAGTTATPFEQRLYGTELALCQRYYYKVLPGAIDKVFNSGYAGSGTSARLVSYFPVTMRTAPAALEQTGTASDYSVYIAAGEVNCSSVPTYSSFTTADLAYVNFTASSMTSGDGVVGITNSTTAYLAWSAEL